MILSLLLFVLSASAINYSDCSNGKGVITVTSLSISPDPPKKGSPVKYDITYNVKERITGGNCTQTISKGRLPLYRSSFSVCSLIPCPIEPNTYKRSDSTNLPNEILSGSYSGEIHCKDPAGTEKLCFKGATQVV